MARYNCYISNKINIYVTSKHILNYSTCFLEEKINKTNELDISYNWKMVNFAGLQLAIEPEFSDLLFLPSVVFCVCVCVSWRGGARVLWVSDLVLWGWMFWWGGIGVGLVYTISFSMYQLFSFLMEWYSVGITY